jgi:hypothetical protein
MKTFFKTGSKYRADETGGNHTSLETTIPNPLAADLSEGGGVKRQESRVCIMSKKNNQPIDLAQEQLLN